MGRAAIVCRSSLYGLYTHIKRILKEKTFTSLLGPYFFRTHIYL